MTKWFVFETFWYEHLLPSSKYASIAGTDFGDQSVGDIALNLSLSRE